MRNTNFFAKISLRAESYWTMLRLCEALISALTSIIYGGRSWEEHSQVSWCNPTDEYATVSLRDNFSHPFNMNNLNFLILDFQIAPYNLWMLIERALMETRLHGHQKNIGATELFLNPFSLTLKKLVLINLNTIVISNFIPSSTFTI